MYVYHTCKSSAAPAAGQSGLCRTDAGADFSPIVEFRPKSLDDPRDGKGPLRELQQVADDHVARFATCWLLVAPPPSWSCARWPSGGRRSRRVEKPQLQGHASFCNPAATGATQFLPRLQTHLLLPTEISPESLLSRHPYNGTHHAASPPGGKRGLCRSSAGVRPYSCQTMS